MRPFTSKQSTLLGKHRNYCDTIERRFDKPSERLDILSLKALRQSSLLLPSEKLRHHRGPNQSFVRGDTLVSCSPIEASTCMY